MRLMRRYCTFPRGFLPKRLRRELVSGLVEARRFSSSGGAGMGLLKAAIVMRQFNPNRKLL